jgi:hypothetical protein
MGRTAADITFNGIKNATLGSTGGILLGYYTRDGCRWDAEHVSEVVDSLHA